MILSKKAVLTLIGFLVISCGLFAQSKDIYNEAQGISYNLLNQIPIKSRILMFVR